MLDPDWKNLADNAREFNLRAYWSLDTDNVIIPALIFIMLLLAAFGFGTSFYYYELNQPVFSVFLVIATIFSLRYITFLLNIAFIIVMLGLSLGALCLAGYVVFEIGKAISWSITDSLEQEKARQSKSSALLETDAGTEVAEKPKYKWEGPDTSGIVDDEPSFKSINPEAWAGTNTGDPLGGLVAKPDPNQIVIEPGYKAVPCEGPLGKDTCIVKDSDAAVDPIPEIEEQPSSPLDTNNQPINTYL